MNHLFKYVLFFSLSMAIIACGNNAIAKEKTVNSTTATPTVKKETPSPVLIEQAGETTSTSAKGEEVEETNNAQKMASTSKIVAPENSANSIGKKVTKPTATAVKTTTAPILTETEASASVETPQVKLENVTTSKEAEAVKEVPKPETPKVTPPSLEPKKEIENPVPPAFSHDAWNLLAQKHISPTGKVNYKGFKTDIVTFDAYLQSLSDNPIQSSWSKVQKMAYWINAYNAFTIKLIVDNYPVKSIMDLEGGKPWDKKWIKLGGKTYSLNNIEHDILRPQFKDARIHFAVNCAAKSCPPVWNKAWTDQNLNNQLARSAKAFINNSTYNQIGKKEVSISKIFEWYAVDFENIIDYLNKFAVNKIDSGATVKYQDYNWNLNE